jgi:predicted CXXCH cytochrome family protein
VDDYTYNNSTKALVNTAEFNASGHGRSTNYPYTGNAGANKGCTDCHDSGVGHGVSTNPFRLNNADTVALCNSCHGSVGNHDYAHVGQGTWGFTPKCVDCHDPHGDKGGVTGTDYNGAMIQAKVAYQGSDTYGVPSGTPEEVDFPSRYSVTNFNWSSFVVNTGQTNKGICRVCHTEGTTNYFTRTVYSSHNSSQGACNTCHGHGNGFKPASDCDGCHPFPGGTDWSTGNGHLVRYDGVTNRHLPASGFDKTQDTYSSVTSDPNKCGLCHPHTVGNPNVTHKDGTVEVSGNGHAACSGSDFTITVTQTGDDVTCSNVSCHAADRSTPNWW